MGIFAPSWANLFPQNLNGEEETDDNKGEEDASDKRGRVLGALLLLIAWVIPAAAITSAGPTHVIPAAFATTTEPPPPLTVHINANQTQGLAPLTVKFTAVVDNGARDTPGTPPPYTYKWDFDDGTTSTQGPTVQHTFVEDREYSVELFVRDANNNVGANAIGISVFSLTPTPAAICLGATITGTSGADNLVGTQGADIINGLGGNDNIAGLGGNDRICGDDGNDNIAGGAANDLMFGEAGDDSLAGGTGNADSANGGIGIDRCSAETRTACEP